MGLMYSCRRIAELISQSHDEPLGVFDRVQLRVHLRMCGNCSNVAQQLDAIHALAGDMFNDGGDERGPRQD